MRRVLKYRPDRYQFLVLIIKNVYGKKLKTVRTTPEQLRMYVDFVESQIIEQTVQNLLCTLLLFITLYFLHLPILFLQIYVNFEVKLLLLVVVVCSSGCNNFQRQLNTKRNLRKPNCVYLSLCVLLYLSFAYYNFEKNPVVLIFTFCYTYFQYEKKVYQPILYQNFIWL